MFAVQTILSIHHTEQSKQELETLDYFVNATISFHCFLLLLLFWNVFVWIFKRILHFFLCTSALERHHFILFIYFHLNHQIIVQVHMLIIKMCVCIDENCWICKNRRNELKKIDNRRKFVLFLINSRWSSGNTFRCNTIPSPIEF